MSGNDPRLCVECGCELEEDEIECCEDCSAADDWADEDEEDKEE